MTVNKFYLKQAVYEVEIDGAESVILMNYSNNNYDVVGKASAKIDEIAQLMLNKKHNVNFAYKYNGKINQEIL